MAIFTKSVLNILNTIKQDSRLVALRWANFQNYISKIDAIRGFKEEVYQDGFFKCDDVWLSEDETANRLG